MVTGSIKLNPVGKTIPISNVTDNYRLYPKLAQMIDKLSEQTISNPEVVNQLLESWSEDAEMVFLKALHEMIGLIVVL